MEIYRIVHRETDKEVDVFMSPKPRYEHNFSSVSEARHSDYSGVYADKVDYKIRKYKLVLIEDDCDPPTEEDYKKKEKCIEKKYKQIELNDIWRPERVANELAVCGRNELVCGEYKGHMFYSDAICAQDICLKVNGMTLEEYDKYLVKIGKRANNTFVDGYIARKRQ